MNKLFPIVLALMFFSCNEEVIAPTIVGCTDDTACNFNEEANENDDSCAYAEENFDCDGNCTADLDECGICAGNGCNLNIYSVFQQFTELQLDGNNYYHFNYDNQNVSDYGTLYYTTIEPMTRIAWTSTDSFTIYHMGQAFLEPVINYSTYSDEDGDGQQLFYVNATLIGDTLDIYGQYYDYPQIIDSIKVIIDSE